MFRKYRITSFSRFTAFLIIMILLIVTGVSMITGHLDASGATEIQYHMVTVEYGDTLWRIAESNSDGSVDLRILVHEIAELNGIPKGSVIQPGQELKVPDMI